MTSPAPVTPSSDLHVQVEAMRWWHIQAAAQLDRTLFEHTAWSEAQFWSELARSNRHYVVLATSTGQVCGYAGVAWVPPEADVQTIAVASSMQSRGWGARLLEHLIDVAIKAQCRRLLLEVRADSTAAINLYTQHGFVRISKRSSYYGPGVDALIMERTLVEQPNVGRSR
ncbi:MAG: ribosomal protein S18-alanine N-acetyltransferase [Candidatus Nanopelagicales bacterium]